MARDDRWRVALMWGLTVRIEGERVEANVPAWLLNAAATHAAINQVKQAARMLAADPVTYGFDDAAVYTVLVQTWDRALTGLRSVAFGRNVADHPAVELLPDPYYMASRGYRALRRVATDLPPWHARSDAIVWRGSVTGDNGIAEPGDLPRIRLALACQGSPGFDVALTGVHSTMNNGRPPGLLDHFVEAHRLLSASWDMERFGRHKFTIDIDGHANAWGFLEKLILGCCVLKVASPYEQWFYDRLRPWEHYIPVKADLSDLTTVAGWCRDNQAQCQWIANNGARLAASLTMEHQRPDIARALLRAAHARRRVGRPHPMPPTAPPDRQDLEDALVRAEDQGSVPRAIDAHARLIAAGIDPAANLMRRHELLREQADFAASQADMEAAIAAEPANDEPRLRLGQFLASIGRHGAAIVQFEQAGLLAPQRHEIGICLAQSCLKLHRLDQAFLAVRHLPDDLPGWWADVRIAALEAYRDCVGDLRTRLRQRRTADANILPEQDLTLATKLHALGRRQAAWRLTQMLMESEPDLFAPAALATDIVARWEGADLAFDYLSALNARTAWRALAIFKIAELQFQRGDYRQVLDVIAGAEPPSASAHAMVAFSATMLRDRPKVIAACHAWSQASPADMLPAELTCATKSVPSPADVVQPQIRQFNTGHFWHGDELPDDVMRSIASWHRLCPSIDQHVYSAERARALLRDHYGTEVERAFDLCDHAAMQANFFRLAWLHQVGGTWIDVDQRCTRNATSLLQLATTANMTAVRSGYINGYLNNAFLSAQAGSPIIEAALATATGTILATARRGERPWRWQAVGAGFLTDLIAQSIWQHGDRATMLLCPMDYGSYATTLRNLAYKISDGIV